MSASSTLEISRCSSCHGRFLPRPGACPRCGSGDVTRHRVPAKGLVLAATELTAPARGWTAPHRLALVELAEGVRVLVLVEGPLPGHGAEVTVARDGDRYTARTPGGTTAGGRGEGESPVAGRFRPPFEPPR